MDPNTQQPTTDSSGKKKILVVEDDFYIRDLYTIQGQLMDLEIYTASDGEEGITKIKSLHPNLVLLDLMMPKVDGMTVLKTIKSDPAFADVKFIITTNLENPGTQEEAKNLGVTDYLLKINNTPKVILETAMKHLS